MKPLPLIHRTNIVRIHGSPGEAISLDEDIETERAHMTAARLRELPGFSAQIFTKLATEQARQHHDLHEGAEILMRILASEWRTAQTRSRRISPRRASPWPASSRAWTSSRIPSRKPCP